jgi:PilZ domain
LRGHVTREDGSVVDVTLIDLSYDGCGVESAVPLTAGETLALAVHRHGIISTTVRWAEGTKAGLLFADEPAVADDAPKELAPRTHERVPVVADITLRRFGRLNFRVRVYDVSPDGCKAEFVERPDIDEQLWVKFDGIEALEGHVCWVEGAEAGLKFARPIHSAVFGLLLKRLR